MKFLKRMLITTMLLATLQTPVASAYNDPLATITMTKALFTYQLKLCVGWILLHDSSTHSTGFEGLTASCRHGAQRISDLEQGCMGGITSPMTSGSTMVLLFCKSGCIEQYYYCYGFTTGNIPRSNTHIYYDQNSGVLTVTSDLTQVADLPIYKDENTSTQESITVMLSDHLIHTLPYLNIPSTPIRSMTGNSLTTSWTLDNTTILSDTLTVHISLDGWHHLAAPFVETVAINIINEPEDQNTNAEAEDVAVLVQDTNEEEDEE